jgi:hypothetical protein
VTAWLNEQGAVTPTGRPFGHTTVRKMLARPRYAGLMPDGAHEGAWEPVLDRETWEAVCAVLDARAAGFSYATNGRRYLLSGIARCDACGSGLQIRQEQHRGKLSGYGCVKPGCRKVQRKMEALDAYVIRRVVNRLGNKGNPAGRIPRSGALAAEFRALASQRAEIEAVLADHTRGQIPALIARLDSVDARLAQLRELSGDDARSRLLSAHEGITEEEFRALPLGTQRSLVSACFEVRVLRATRRGPGFNPDDVTLIPR